VIHVLLSLQDEGVDGRDKAGHDERKKRSLQIRFFKQQNDRHCERQRSNPSRGIAMS
jgi:hypothetical protein